MLTSSGASISAIETVTFFAHAFRIGLLFDVSAFRHLVLAAMDVVASVAHALRIMVPVGMRALGYRPSPLL